MGIKCVVRGNSKDIHDLADKMRIVIPNFNEEVKCNLPESVEPCNNCSAVFYFKSDYVNFDIFNGNTRFDVTMEMPSGTWRKKKSKYYGKFSKKVEPLSAFSVPVKEYTRVEIEEDDSQCLGDFEDLESWEKRNYAT